MTTYKKRKSEIIELLNDSDFFNIAYKYYLGHIDFKRWTNPEYNEDFDSDFIIKHWDSISIFMRSYQE